MDAGSADGPGPRPDDAAAAQPVAVLEELLAARGEHLLRTAVLLAGSRADGEDLLQAALERLFRRWRTIRGDPEGYLRRTLYHLAADGWRRNGAWRARLRLLGHPASVPDGTDAVDQRDQIIRLLSALPPRQRTAVVLRYWEDLSEAEAARAMGCSVGTVKAACSRGLRRLRELSDGAPGERRARRRRGTSTDRENGMSIDFEDQLRAEMGRVQVRPRPGLAREAHRRYARSRRRTALAVAATGTAAAVAGATAGFALTAGTPGTGPIETTAYVVEPRQHRAGRDRRDRLLHSRVSGHGVPAGLPIRAVRVGVRRPDSAS